MNNITDVINEAIVSETLVHVNIDKSENAFGIMASPSKIEA